MKFFMVNLFCNLFMSNGENQATMLSLCKLCSSTSTLFDHPFRSRSAFPTTRDFYLLEIGCQAFFDTLFF